jgi:flagellar biosynthetic protein FliO
MSRPNASMTSTRRLAAALAGSLIALTLTAPVAAQEGTNGGGIGAGVSTFGLGDWFGLLARLALVVLVIWGAVYAMRWYVRRVNGGGLGARAKQLRILESHALGPNRALHLVRLGDHAVLIGVTPERITSLIQIEDTDEIERLSETPEEPERRGMASVRSGLSIMQSAMHAGMRASAGSREPLFARLTANAPAPGSVAALEAELSDDDAVAADALMEQVAAEQMPPPERRAAIFIRAVIDGFARLPQAFGLGGSAQADPLANPAPFREREPEVSGAEPAKRGVGLFERTMAASRRQSPGYEAAAFSDAGPAAGSFSAALAAMEAQERQERAQVTRSQAGRPQEVRSRTAISDPATLTREEQIEQAQRAIAAVRESVFGGERRAG